MTKFSKEQYECPYCKNMEENTMYETVNVTLNPSLREKVFSGEIFECTCTKCGKTTTILYNLLYHDMTNKFMIYFTPTDIESINQHFNELLSRYPGLRRPLHRTVDRINALKEKVLILEAGLNDIVIEFAKVMAKYSNDTNLPENCNLLFEGVIKSKENQSKDAFILRVMLQDKPQKKMMVITREQYDYYLSIAQKESLLNMDRYCDTVNEQWILNRISK